MKPTANALRRAQILADCAKLFRRLGYDGTAMSDIAAAVNLNKGTLYYYYPSKADTLYAIFLRAFEELDEQIALVPSDLPPDQELAALIKAVLHTIASAPDTIAVYFQEHPWVKTSLTPVQYETVCAREAEFTDRIREVIRRGVRVNAFRRVNDELLTVQLISMISSLYRWHLAENATSADLVADTIISYLYDGITPGR